MPVTGCGALNRDQDDLMNNTVSRQVISAGRSCREPSRSSKAVSVRLAGGLKKRIVPAGVLITCVGLLSVAAWLKPSASGVGTHTQLGLPPCGFETAFGLPCATCGMTTAFAHAADGHLLAAFLTQPAGAVLAVLTAVTCLLSANAVIRGVSLGSILRYLWRPGVAWAVVVLVMVSWLYKIASYRGLL